MEYLKYISIKQVQFLDKQNNAICDGIMLENGDVICMCCGGLIEHYDIGPEEDSDDLDYVLVKTFEQWKKMKIPTNERM